METAPATPDRSVGFPDWMALSYAIAAAGAFAFWAAVASSLGAEFLDPSILTNMIAGPLTAIVAAFALCRSRVAGASAYFVGSAVVVVWWLANLQQDRGWVAPAVFAMPMSLLGIRGLATRWPQPGDIVEGAFWRQVALSFVCLTAIAASFILGGFGMKLAADLGLLGPASGGGPNPMARFYRDESNWYLGYAVVGAVAFLIALLPRLRRSVGAPILAGGGLGLAGFAMLMWLR